MSRSWLRSWSEGQRAWRVRHFVSHPSFATAICPVLHAACFLRVWLCPLLDSCGTAQGCAAPHLVAPVGRFSPLFHALGR